MTTMVLQEKRMPLLGEGGMISAIAATAVTVGSAFGWLAKSRTEGKRVSVEAEDSLSKHEELIRRFCVDMISGLERRVTEQANQINDQAQRLGEALTRLSEAVDRDVRCQARLSVFEAELKKVKLQQAVDRGK